MAVVIGERGRTALRNHVHRGSGSRDIIYMGRMLGGNFKEDNRMT